jgi:hypothetical protein
VTESASTISERRRRKFTLFDAVSLVAATAVGLWGLRIALGSLQQVRQELSDSLTALAHFPDAGHGTLWSVIECYALVETVLFPFAWSLTLVAIALRFHGTHPPRRRLGRQPGTIACISAALILVPALLFLIGLMLICALLPDIKLDDPTWQKGLGFYFILIPTLCGIAVLSGWAALVVGRRCRFESSWVDRLGCALGVYWISAIPLPAWAMM